MCSKVLFIYIFSVIILLIMAGEVLPIRSSVVLEPHPITGLVTPEPYATTPRLLEIQNFRLSAATELQSLVRFQRPSRLPWRWQPAGKVHDSAIARYRAEEQEANRMMLAWVRRRVGEKAVALYTQEEEKVGDETTLIGKPMLRAITTRGGDISYGRMMVEDSVVPVPPSYYEGIWTEDQQLEAITRVRNTVLLVMDAPEAPAG